MKTALIVAGCLLSLSALAGVDSAGTLTWVDYEAGMAQALKTGKPAVIYFTADW